MNTKPTKPENNHLVLTDNEFEETIYRVGEHIRMTSSIMGKEHEKKITAHLEYIASCDVSVLTDPTHIHDNSGAIKQSAALTKFYTQLKYLLLSSRTGGYPDFYVRLCNNLSAGLVSSQDTSYGIDNYKGGILELAQSLTKKKYFFLVRKPAPSVAMRLFFIKHPHLVLQLLIAQFYQRTASA